MAKVQVALLHWDSPPNPTPVLMFERPMPAASYFSQDFSARKPHELRQVVPKLVVDFLREALKMELLISVSRRYENTRVFSKQLILLTPTLGAEQPLDKNLLKLAELAEAMCGERATNAELLAKDRFVLDNPLQLELEEVRARLEIAISKLEKQSPKLQSRSAKKTAR